MENITFNQLAYRLIALYRAEYKDTDSLPIELVKEWIHSVRALLLKQRLTKPFSHYSQSIIQTLGPVELESVDSSIFFDIPSDKYMLRTVRKIPLPINTPGNLGAFTRIGPADRLSVKFKQVSYDTALYTGYGKFNSRDIHTFMLDEKLYIISRDLLAFKDLEQIDIHGVFQNPESAALFKNPDWTHDDEYPIDRHLVEDMEKIITETKFRFVIQGIKDPLMDDTDSLTKPQTEGGEEQSKQTRR